MKYEIKIEYGESGTKNPEKGLRTFTYLFLCFFCCPGAYAFALLAPVIFFICPGGILPDGRV